MCPFEMTNKNENFFFLQREQNYGKNHEMECKKWWFRNSAFICYRHIFYNFCSQLIYILIERGTEMWLKKDSFDWKGHQKCWREMKEGICIDERRGSEKEEICIQKTDPQNSFFCRCKLWHFSLILSSWFEQHSSLSIYDSHLLLNLLFLSSSSCIEEDVERREKNF